MVEKKGRVADKDEDKLDKYTSEIIGTFRSKTTTTDNAKDRQLLEIEHERKKIMAEQDKLDQDEVKELDKLKKEFMEDKTGINDLMATLFERQKENLKELEKKRLALDEARKNLPSDVREDIDKEQQKIAGEWKLIELEKMRVIDERKRILGLVQLEIADEKQKLKKEKKLVEHQKIGKEVFETMFKQLDGQMQKLNEERKQFGEKFEVKTKKETVEKTIDTLKAISNYIQKGSEFYKNGLFVDAIMTWSKVLSLNPNHAESWTAIELGKSKLYAIMHDRERLEEEKKLLEKQRREFADLEARRAELEQMEQGILEEQRKIEKHKEEVKKLKK